MEQDINQDVYTHSCNLLQNDLECLTQSSDEPESESDYDEKYSDTISLEGSFLYYKGICV